MSIHFLVRVKKYICLQYIPYVWQDCVTTEQHRVAMATFWRTFIMRVKSAKAGQGGGVHALPLSIYLPSRSKLWCAPQLRGQLHSSSTPICTLWCYCRIGRANNLFTHSSKNSIQKNPQKAVWFTLYRGGGRYSIQYIYWQFRFQPCLTIG